MERLHNVIIVSLPNSEFTDILKSTMEGVFTPWKLVNQKNPTNQDLFFLDCWLFNIYQHNTG